MHFANPSGLNWGTRRVKNEERDAVDLIDMLRLGRLPRAWIAPPATRELRELVRFRAKLVALAVRAQGAGPCGARERGSVARDQFGRGGNAQVDALELAEAYALRGQVAARPRRRLRRTGRDTQGNL